MYKLSQMSKNFKILRYGIIFMAWERQFSWLCWVWNRAHFLTNKAYSFIWKLKLSNMEALVYSSICSVHTFCLCAWMCVRDICVAYVSVCICACVYRSQKRSFGGGVFLYHVPFIPLRRGSLNLELALLAWLASASPSDPCIPTLPATLNSKHVWNHI